MSLCNSEHRWPRGSQSLRRPQVRARHGGAWLDIEPPLYPRPQSSPLHVAPSPVSSASVTPSSLSLFALGQVSISAEMTTLLQAFLMAIQLIMGQPLRFFSPRCLLCFQIFVLPFL